MGADFQKANPDTTVTFNFAASSALVQQIQGGAPADVFASADGANMQKLVSGEQVTAEPTVFAANELTIVVKPGNPEKVKSLADLADLDVVSLCARRGAVRQVRAAGAHPGRRDHRRRRRSRKGADVKATLAAVSTGDADAAIVYMTDAKAAGTSVQSVRDPRVAERATPSTRSRRSPRPRTRTSRTRGSRTRSRPPARRPCRASGSCRRRLRVSRRGRGVPLVAVAPRPRRRRVLRAPAGRAAASARRGATCGTTSPDPAARDAIRLSIECSLWSTAFAVVFGVPLAYVLARARFPGRALVRALVVLPMVLPPVVGGVALLSAFQRNGGLVGGWIYDVFDFQFTFSKWGVVLAETFVAMPFLVITVEAGLRSMDRRYEDAAASLGAGRWTVFRRVTVPLIAPALIAGAALAWARALGEFGATITFAGNIQGRTQTTPLAVYLLLESNPPVRDRAQPGAARGLDRRARVAARPLVRGPA